MMCFFLSVKSLNLIQILFWVFAVSVSAAGSLADSSKLSQNNNVPLRILPLGDSITFGFLSTDGNGFRKRLLDLVTTDGTAQYAGSVRAGNMADNRNEGHPGAIITEIADFSRVSLVMRPNLILLMAGTNDMNNNILAGATDRLGNLIDMCFTACPDAVILVAQLTPSTNASVEARVELFNPTVLSLATSRGRSGVKIAAVNMMNFVTTADLVDDLHPNDIGYAKMADAWFEGIQQASAKGWLTPPVDITGAPQGVEVANPVPAITTSALNILSPAAPIASTSFLTSQASTVTITNVVTTILPIPTSSEASLTTSNLAVPPALSTSTRNASFFALAAPTKSPTPSASKTAKNDASPSTGRALLGGHHLVYILAFAGIWLWTLA